MHLSVKAVTENITSPLFLFISVTIKVILQISNVWKLNVFKVNTFYDKNNNSTLQAFTI